MDFACLFTKDDLLQYPIVQMYITPSVTAGVLMPAVGQVVFDVSFTKLWPVRGHCIVTLFSSLPILMQKSFWWRQFSLFPHLHTPSPFPFLNRPFKDHVYLPRPSVHKHQGGKWFSACTERHGVTEKKHIWNSIKTNNKNVKPMKHFMINLLFCVRFQRLRGSNPDSSSDGIVYLFTSLELTACLQRNENVCATEKFRASPTAFLPSSHKPYGFCGRMESWKKGERGRRQKQRQEQRQMQPDCHAGRVKTLNLGKLKNCSCRQVCTQLYNLS